MVLKSENVRKAKTSPSSFTRSGAKTIRNRLRTVRYGLNPGIEKLSYDEYQKIFKKSRITPRHKEPGKFYFFRVCLRTNLLYLKKYISVFKDRFGDFDPINNQLYAQKEDFYRFFHLYAVRFQMLITFLRCFLDEMSTLDFWYTQKGD